MAIEWSQDGWGGAWRGMDDDRFVAQVAPYGDWQIGPGGANGLDQVVVDGQHWAAFVRGQPVGQDRYATAQEAMAAVEQAHDVPKP